MVGTDSIAKICQQPFPKLQKQRFKVNAFPDICLQTEAGNLLICDYQMGPLRRKDTPGRERRSQHVELIIHHLYKQI